MDRNNWSPDGNEPSVEDLQKRIEELEKEVKFLNCLRAAGVDNWEGIAQAEEMMEENS